MNWGIEAELGSMGGIFWHNMCQVQTLLVLCMNGFGRTVIRKVFSFFQKKKLKNWGHPNTSHNMGVKATWCGRSHFSLYKGPKKKTDK